MQYLVAYSKKINAIILSIIVISALIFIRLTLLQITSADYFFHKSKKNFTRISTIESPRGNILDRYGKPLATNRPIANVYWHGTGNRKITEEQHNQLKDLETILDTALLENENLLASINRAEHLRKEICLASDITFEQLSQIEESFPNEQNIIIETHFKRHYPQQSLACHIVGYLGSQLDLGTEGRMGLEKLFQETLQGRHGSLVKTINSVGRNLGSVELQKAMVGGTIQTTIESSMQAICEDVFPAEYNGAFIIMDPKDGDILSVLSRPNFNPTMFLKPISSKEWQQFQENQPFLNRAFNASYPPGSIFKLVTACAALENNLVNEDSVSNCCGFTEFCGRKYYCSRRWGHGKLSTVQAIGKSCNPFFFEIGKRIDINVLTHYAHRFGLGQKTNICFPEKTGLVPSREWKRAVKGEPWWPGETLSAAIGQTYLLATPIQIVRMIGSIFTGYLTKPRLLIHEPICIEPLNLRQKTLNLLQNSMKKVVTMGTGLNVSRVKDITIYAKTSTAQTSSWEKRKLKKEYLEHAWFAGYFQYKEQEPLAFVILVENAGSSSVATNIAKNFLIEYKKYVDSMKMHYS